MTIPLSSVHVYALISSIGLPQFHLKKGGQLATVTYLSVLSTLHKSNNNQLGVLLSFNNEVRRPV